LSLNMSSLDEFGEFRTPSGRVWNLTATPLSPGGDDTNDQGCVAVAHHPDGRVVLADTKLDLTDQKPLVFLPAEWQNFTDAVRDGRI
jgi:Domain of unknown function (DUF397)